MLDGTDDLSTDALRRAMRSAQPFCAVSVGTQSLNDVTLTDILWDTDTNDTWGMHNTSANQEQIVIPVAGRYAVGVWLLFDTAGSYPLQIRVMYEDGASTQIARTILLGNSAGLATFLPCSTVVWSMTKGAYVHVEGYQSSGGALNVTSGRLTVARIS